MFIVKITDRGFEFGFDDALKGEEKTYFDNLLKSAKIQSLELYRSRNSALGCNVRINVSANISSVPFADSKLNLTFGTGTGKFGGEKLDFFITSFSFHRLETDDAAQAVAHSYVIEVNAVNYIFHLLSTKKITTVLFSRSAEDYPNEKEFSIASVFTKDIKTYVLPDNLAEKKFGKITIADNNKNFLELTKKPRYKPPMFISDESYYSYLMGILAFYQNSAGDQRTLDYQLTEFLAQVYYNFYYDKDNKLNINICQSTAESDKVTKSLESVGTDTKLDKQNTYLTNTSCCRDYIYNNKTSDSVSASLSAIHALLYNKEVNCVVSYPYTPITISGDGGKKETYYAGAVALQEDRTFGAVAGGEYTKTRALKNVEGATNGSIKMPITEFNFKVYIDKNGSEIWKVTLAADRAYIENVEEIGRRVIV